MFITSLHPCICGWAEIMTDIFLGTQKGDMKFWFLFHITFIAIKRLLQISTSL